MFPLSVLVCVRCFHVLKLSLGFQKRNISRKISIGDNQSSMDVNLACNHSDRETPTSDSIEIQSIVIPGKHCYIPLEILLFFFSFLYPGFCISWCNDFQLLDL